ncbi:MAG: OmpW family outer membrane protein [Methylophilus sp.]|nr:OmpW family outer membrane protein [Methylophilus sp.]
MKKTLLSILIAAAFAPVLAQAEAGDIVVRLRAVDVSPNEDSKLGTTVNNALGATVMSPGAELAVDSNLIPELDISYYFTKNIAAELILALGTRHDVSVKGDALATVTNQNLGSVNLLPPTLTVQWHFNPDQTFDPYIGAGVTYSRSLDHNLTFQKGALTGQPIKIDDNMFGAAIQAGLDINLKDGWLINADVKYAWLDTDVKAQLAPGAAWTKIDSLNIDPWVIGIGIGKKF